MGDQKSAQLTLKVYKLENELREVNVSVEERDVHIDQLKEKVGLLEVQLAELQDRLREAMSGSVESRALSWQTAELWAEPEVPKEPGEDEEEDYEEDDAREERLKREAGERLLASENRGGVRVAQLASLWATVQADAEAYGEAHFLHGGRHCCCADECAFEHHDGPPNFAHGNEKAAPVIPDVQLVVDRYVVPRTRELQCSYAILLAAKGDGVPPEPTTFVSHWWGENFGGLVDTLDLALGPQEPVFLSAFCLNLHGEQAAPPGSSVFPESLLRRPSLVAAVQCSRFLAVVDIGAVYPTRAWCALEACTAAQADVPVLLWPHRRADLRQLRDVLEGLRLRPDSAAATASTAKPLQRHVEDHGGFQWLTSFTVEVLLDRLAVFASAFNAMCAAREGGGSQPLQKSDVLYLRTLHSHLTSQLARGRGGRPGGDDSGVRISAHSEEALLRGGSGGRGRRIEFARVEGPLCRQGSYVPEVWDGLLCRAVLRVHGLCLFACRATLCPGGGTWRLILSVKREADFAFDSEVILRLNGVVQSQVRIEHLVPLVGFWTPVAVGTFVQLVGGSQEVEISLETVPVVAPAPKFGLWIDRARAELVA